MTLQFNYSSLEWMFRSKTLNNGTNSIHERALRFAYRDKKKGTIEELLEKDNLS